MNSLRPQRASPTKQILRDQTNLIKARQRDLARIEVLRGPQGTQYGASGVNGIVQMLTYQIVLLRFCVNHRAPFTVQDDLEEIIVTAQKRAQRLQDIPTPISARVEALRGPQGTSMAKLFKNQ